MTANQFRKIALALEGVEESSHMNHPDFRANGRIFATLGAPDKTRGMVGLTPELQVDFIKASPKTFEPVAGGWGRGGATLVKLPTADPESVGAALSEAYKIVMSKPAARKKTTKKK